MHAIDPLWALSPYDGRYADVGATFSPWFSEGGLIQTRHSIELQYLSFLTRESIIRPFTAKEKKQLEALEHLDNTALARVKEIEKTTHHDVHAVVTHLQEMLGKTSLADVAGMVHFGLTSEDVNNLAWRMGLVRARDTTLIPELTALTGALGDMAARYKSLPMLARTHGQPAVPTTFGKELINVAMRLHTQCSDLTSFTFQGKVTGAIGNFNALVYAHPETDWLGVSDRFVQTLGFTPHHFTTQVHPNDDVASYLSIVSRINGILHGFNQDMWRYISDELVAQKAEGVGSSTMPQKINPIDFEHSEGVIEVAHGLIDVLATRLVESRLQRDLSDTPLFRFLGVIHALTWDAWHRTAHGLGRVAPNEARMRAMVNQNWAILAESTQLLLKNAGIAGAYDVVKQKTQGRSFTSDAWVAMLEELIGELAITDASLIAKLAVLTPETYCGYAERLTEEGIVMLAHTA